LEAGFDALQPKTPKGKGNFSNLMVWLL
jgi:hypothetical protein